MSRRGADPLMRMLAEAEVGGGYIWAEEATIETTAEAEGTQVFVTLPNSEAPHLAEPVAYWRVAVSVDEEGGLSARYPQEGKTGIAIRMDTGEIWLIF